MRNHSRYRFSRYAAHDRWHYGEPRVIRAKTFQEPIIRVISAALEKELLGHPGKWAAITQTELVAVGDDFADVLAEARAKGVPDPIMWPVPEPGITYTFEAGA